MRRNRRVPPRPPRFAFVCDGECEVWYIQMLKRNEREIGITLSPEIPQKKELEEQYKRVVALSKDYDKVFWIIDLDTINSESRSAAKGKKTALQKLKEYIATIEKINSKKSASEIIVIINNPCLEFWFLLHFETTSKYFDNCDQAGKQLKKHLPEYEKTRKYFTKENNDIYLKLKPNLATALANAQTLGKFDLDNPHSGMTQMQLFFEVSGIVAK